MAEPERAPGAGSRLLGELDPQLEVEAGPAGKAASDAEAHHAPHEVGRAAFEGTMQHGMPLVPRAA